MSESDPLNRAIGGFLPLELEGASNSGGVLGLWGVTEHNSWAFSNARSALAHLLQSAKAKRLLLPAFICPELVSAAAGDIPVVFYALTPTLSPDVTSLTATLRSGDCVVAVDYFGRVPDEAFRSFISARPDALWVEDRAQALFPAKIPWADWVLYSPRKLFGVPDGGLMVRISGKVSAVDHSSYGNDNRIVPREMRRQDTEERDNALWYAEYQRVEAKMAVSREPMSATTRQLLSGIDTDSVIQRRRENFETLFGLLQDFAFFNNFPEIFAPFGFPIRVPDRDTVSRALIENRVFTARYWPELPSDPDAFPVEHALNRELLLLPCDQRYNGGDMHTVARAVRDAIA